MPDGGDPIPSDEDIFAPVERRYDDDGAWVTFNVREGFVSAGRRPDNLGERAIVRAIIASCFDALSEKADEDQINGIVNAVGKRSEERRVGKRCVRTGRIW